MIFVDCVSILEIVQVDTTVDAPETNLLQGCWVQRDSLGTYTHFWDCFHKKSCVDEFNNSEYFSVWGQEGKKINETNFTQSDNENLTLFDYKQITKLSPAV